MIARLFASNVTTLSKDAMLENFGGSAIRRRREGGREGVCRAQRIYRRRIRGLRASQEINGEYV